MRARVVAFAALVVVCLAGIVGSVLLLGDDDTAGVSAGEGEQAAPGGSTTTTIDTAEAMVGPHVLYRSTPPDADFGRVAVAPLGDTEEKGWTELRCERVDAAADRGICLVSDRGAFTSYATVIFDREGNEVSRTDLVGLPSRTRVSPDGRYGSTTTFVSGDSYAADSFSTRTRILDLATGEVIADLEQFTARDGDRVVDAVDRNFWGVTFAEDSDRFYATMATGGHRYLVEGSVADRTVQVVRDGVECPSLSPDGTRVAFKERIESDFGRVTWRLAVLDLATGEVTTLAEEGNVDDQAEWLDDDTVLYARPRAESGTSAMDTWAVPADGSGEPTLFLPGAYSAVVVP